MRMWIGLSLLGIFLMGGLEAYGDTGDDSGTQDSGAEEGDTGGDDTGNDTGTDSGDSEPEDPGTPTTELAGESGGHACTQSAAILLMIPLAAWRRRRLC